MSLRRDWLPQFRDPLALIALPFAAAGFLVPVCVALFASDNLLVTVMKDDGFYFLVLARNLAHGLGITFDGISPTNGFHPLWAFLLVPLHLVRSANVLVPARLALLLSALLHLAGSAAVFAAARALTNRRGALLAGLFFLANPLGVYLATSGMESPLVSLLVALVALIYIRIRQGDADLSRAWVFVPFGGLTGLCLLARTDLVLLAAPMFAGALYVSFKDARARRRDRPLVAGRGLAAAAGIAALTVSPWIVWNLVRFGTIVQVSARAHHLHSLMRRSWSVSGGPAGSLRLGTKVLAQTTRLIADRMGVPVPVVVALALAVVAWLVFWLWSALGPRESRAQIARRLSWMDAPLVYAIGFLAGCFFVLGHMRSWYVAGPLAVWAIAMGIVAWAGSHERALSRRAQSLSKSVYLAALIGLLPLWVLFGREAQVSNTQMHAWREAAAWVSANTEPGDRVASFNTGAFAYLTPRTVINLDCVINNRGISWLERRDLIGYIRSEQIRYVIDHPNWAGMYIRGLASRDADALVPVDTLRSDLVVYAVR